MYLWLLHLLYCLLLIAAVCFGLFELRMQGTNEGEAVGLECLLGTDPKAVEGRLGLHELRSDRGSNVKAEWTQDQPMGCLG